MKTVPNIPPAWKNISDLFVALGDEHRQRILLSFEPGEQLSISDIAAAMPLSRTAVTHHLKVLETGGVLKSEKVGKEVRFYINKAHMQEALRNVVDFIDSNI